MPDLGHVSGPSICYTRPMPSALLERLEEALDNPAFGDPVPVDGPPSITRKMGRPKVLPDGYKTMNLRLSPAHIKMLDAKRGTKSRSQFIRDLIEQL